MRTGLGYLFDLALTNTPEKVAVIQGDQSVTYRELDQRANRVGRALLGSVIGPGDRVALLFDNDHRFLECYFGVMRTGAVVVPVNFRLTDETIQYILEHSDARALICSPSQAGRAGNLLTGRHRVEVPVALDEANLRMLSYSEWTGRESGEQVNVRVALEDIAMHAYTSGSTGKPKGVLLSHGGQCWNAAVTSILRGVNGNDRALTAAPLCHKNAMASAIKPLLLQGGSVVILPSFNPETYLEAVDRHDVTYTTGVPAMYRMLFSRPELFRKYDVSRVRFCFIGSAELTPELRDTVPRFFPNAMVREGYGSTEGGPVTLIQPADGKPGYISVVGAEHRIIREDGSDCEPGEVGELLLKNPGMLVGYYKDPELTAERIRDGWYHSGDLFRRTVDHRYFMVGRKDDMINTGGENVFPKEVEDVLLRHPQVADACVVPIPHAVKGVVPVAFIVLRQPEAASEQEIKEFFLARGPAFAHPRRIFFIDALPYSAPGKVDRKLLKRQAAELAAAQA